MPDPQPILPFRRPKPAQPVRQQTFFGDKTEPTFGELAASYLAVKRKRWCVDTYKRREQILDQFLVEFRNRLPSEVHPSDFEVWLDRQENWPAQGTRWSVCYMVNAMLNWGVRDLRILYNPFRGVEVEPGDPRRPTAASEFQQMLRAADLPMRWVLIFLRFAAARPGEARTVEWPWVRWGLQQIEIPPRRHKTGKKTRQPRIVPLLPPALALLRWLRTRCDGVGPIFRNAQGRPWTRSAFSQRLKALRARAGIAVEATFHGLRHLFGTEWVKAGGNLKLLSQFLGHASVATTERYYVHGEELHGAVAAEAQRVMQAKKRALRDHAAN